MRQRIDALDTAFTVIFLLEVLLNLIINWFRAFLFDLWNLVDVTILVISFYGLTRSEKFSFMLLDY